MRSLKLMALDVGTKRIGIALADSFIKIAIPFTTVEVNNDVDSAIKQIIEIISKEEIDVLVVGLPRNQSGEETSQSAFSIEFVKNFEYSVDKICFQDASLTSIQAENRLKSYGKPYSKGDIDMNAASIILQDYLEENF